MVKNNINLDTDKNLQFNGQLEITDKEFVSQAKIDEVMAVVNSLNFEQMDNKLIKTYGWSERDISLINKTYKEWLVISACYPDAPLVPTMKLDEYWHMHILDTKKYMEDCQLLFGSYMHHHPYFGESDSDYADKCFSFTKELFKKHFKNNMSNNSADCHTMPDIPDCGTHGCRANCN